MTPDELRRYSRHLLLPEVGEAGQRRLKAARVLVVGAGGLGSPALIYLAAAGVGTLGLVEFDAVDASNLQRQILYRTGDVGRSKLVAAVEHLRAMNPHVAFEAHDGPFAAGNARALVEAYDLVLDGTDNFPSRYLVNDACVMTGTPNVYGSVFRFEGQASVFAAHGRRTLGEPNVAGESKGPVLSEPSAGRFGESKGPVLSEPSAGRFGESKGPCYRCLHPEPPPPGLIPSCAEGGVLGVLPGLIGLIQATEAIKLITGIGEPLVGRLLLYDALRMRFREITLHRDPDCPVCGDHPTIRELVAYDQACAPMPPATSMTVEELLAWRQAGEPHVLIDVREPSEHAICHIEGATLIPLGQLMGRLDAIPTDRPVVMQCKSGARSARATEMLRQKGYDARNLTGGILAWIDSVDPSLSRY